MNLNKHFVSLLLSTGLSCLSAQAEIIGDTLVLEDVSKVKIETRDTLQRIVISGTKDEPYFQYIQRISIPDTSAVRRRIKSVKDFNKVEISESVNHSKALGLSFHIGAGWNIMTGAPDNYHFKWKGANSFYYNVLADWRPCGKKNIWSIGLGMEWRQYLTDANLAWQKNADGFMDVTPYPNGQHGKKTSLREVSLQLPLLYTHYLSQRQRWGLSLGGVVNWNFNAHALWQYSSDANDYKTTVDCPDIHQRPFSVDMMAILQMPTLFSVYCKYTPTTFFRDSYGPKMHQLTIGVCL